jgi:serine phosphatase RsbU (regulator of sigma subunit)
VCTPFSQSAWADLAERLPQVLPQHSAGRLSCPDLPAISLGASSSSHGWGRVVLPGHETISLEGPSADLPWLLPLVATCCALVCESESLSCELAATYGKLALLDELGRNLPRCPDADSIATALAESIRCTVAGAGSLLQRLDAGTWRILRSWGGESQGRIEEPAAYESLSQRGRPLVVDNGPLPTAIGLDTPTGPSCMVPLIGPEQAEGLWVMARSEGRPFASDETKLLELAAAQGAGALGRLRHEAALREASLLEHDLAIAARIQQNLLPRRLPELVGYDMAGRLRSARTIGGDYYDALLGHQGCWLVVADVSGHSVPSALAMSMVRTALRTALPAVAGPADLLELLNRQLCQDLQHSTLFVSLVVCLLQAGSGRFTIANAGHPPVLQRHADGRCTAWDAEGGIIGLLPEAGFEELEGQLAPGESLLFHTDGITELATRDDGQPFGLGGLRGVLREESISARDLLDRIERQLARCCPGEPADDTTLLAVKRLSGPAA